MPIGFFDYEIKNGELYLHNITLSEDYKRLGIGSYILSLVCEEGKVRVISTLKGKIFYKNKKALAWAKKHNVKILGRLPSEKSYITKKFILEK
ncbi:hypothetical protein HYX18_00315 [Candidatus Woesearchaeota archaeon]|nr:hypothetical protein [Candidatus Woesearchaeota archaeon]